MLRESYNLTHGTTYTPSDPVPYAHLSWPPSAYDARCACCWLNHGHTWAKHEAMIHRYHQTVMQDV